MTCGIQSTEFYLIDNWPGEPTSGPNPADWTVASANIDFPLGTKRMVYDDTNSGWATLMFLKFVKGAVAEPDLGIGKHPLCAMNTAAAASGDYFVISNNGDSVSFMGPMAIVLGKPTTSKPYVWCWVGGVCPEDTVPDLAGFAYVSNAAITAMGYMVMGSSASYVSFHLAVATDVANFSAFSLVVGATT